jgi:soluble lytic murein transglycosylase
VVARFPRDSSAGAALMLLADLATDEGRDGAARDAYRQAVAVLPRGSERAALARFRGAVIDLAAGAPRQAAAALDSLVALDPRGAETNAAIYWSGRAWAASGDSARARERWRAMTARDPLSYYASASARRLGEAAWSPPSASDDGAPGGAIAEAIERGARLEAVGMDAERRLELDALAREAAASASADRMLATAAAFRAAGEPSRGINMALRALDAGAPRDARLYRLLYPLDHHEALAEDARANGLDAALVAALVRQESRWTARATSAAGARGLMQVLPSVGGSLARVAGVAPWDPVLLYEPEVNLLLGTRHLRNYFARYAGGAAVAGDSLTMHARALAAYNAGQSRVTRWAGKHGVADPELFIERIPFAETRDYVRIVLRNAELYRALYEW